MLKLKLDERAAVESDDVRAQPRKRATESAENEKVSLEEQLKTKVCVEPDRSTPNTLQTQDWMPTRQTDSEAPHTPY